MLATTETYHHSGFPISLFSDDIAIRHRGVAKQNVLQQSRVEINGTKQFDICKIGGSLFNFQEVSAIGILSFIGYNLHKLTGLSSFNLTRRTLCHHFTFFFSDTAPSIGSWGGEIN
ncbi:MAG: hypothetical protein V7K21_16885 [Nostoc sp.]|uniref:hypothetical protein n=1 Tax=Nostoc sp. TaxID=1180 RepID=UPI002FF54730